MGPQRIKYSGFLAREGQSVNSAVLLFADVHPSTQDEYLSSNEISYLEAATGRPQVRGCGSSRPNVLTCVHSVATSDKGRPTAAPNGDLLPAAPAAPVTRFPWSPASPARRSDPNTIGILDLHQHKESFVFCVQAKVITSVEIGLD